MKILHLNDRSEPGGGVEVYLQGLMPALQRAGHDAKLFSGPEALSDSPSLRSCLRDFQPDVVHLHNGAATTARDRLFADIPLVKTVHVYNTVCPAGTYHLQHTDTVCQRARGPYCWISPYLHGCHSLRPWVIAQSYQVSRTLMKADRQADKVLTASAYVRGRLLQNGFEAEQVDVLPYAIDLPAPSDAAPFEGPLRDGYVLFIGRLYPEKGLTQLLKALRAAPVNIPLVVMGEGSEKYSREVRQLADDLLPGQVHWVGWQNGNEKNRYLSRSRVLAIPSIWPEPFGIVGLEAMAFRKPVVAYDVGGIREWLQDQNTGYLVPAGDVEQFGTCLKRCVDDAALARTFGYAGRQSVEQSFTYEAHISRLLDLYRKAA